MIMANQATGKFWRREAGVSDMLALEKGWESVGRRGRKSGSDVRPQEGAAAAVNPAKAGVREGRPGFLTLLE
jgi:hypothetical protein